MNKYNEIEVKTAENLLKEGYKWIARNKGGKLTAHAAKPSKVDTYWWSVGYSDCTCNYVPIFQNIRFEDKEPTSLESIVHPQILDDAEKRYLSAVIRPFRNRVEYIKKVDGVFEEYIHIQLNKDWAFLPHFRPGTMYKGMKLGYEYSLEELGI